MLAMSEFEKGLGFGVESLLFLTHNTRIRMWLATIQ